jgi:acetoin utilization protein AcuB
MLRTVRVYKWMSPAETVSSDTPFQRAHAIMEQKAVRCLIVVDAGQMVGILTRGDIRHAMPSDEITKSIWDVNQTWDKITVARIMTPVVITIAPSTNITQAIRLMMKHKISRLPVVDRRGQLLGILTADDIYRMLVESRKSESVSSSRHAAYSA